MQTQTSRRFISALVDDATTSSFLTSLLRLKHSQEQAERATDAPTPLAHARPVHNRAA